MMTNFQKILSESILLQISKKFDFSINRERSKLKKKRLHFVNARTQKYKVS